MDKLQEIFAGLSKKEDRKYNKFVIIFAVIGIAAVAGLIIYAVWAVYAARVSGRLR